MTVARAWDFFCLIASVAAAFVGTLFWVVFVMAGMANTKPEEAPFFRNLILSIVAGGLVCMAAGGWLAYERHPWWALLVGVAPFIIMFAVMIYVSAK